MTSKSEATSRRSSVSQRRYDVPSTWLNLVDDITFGRSSILVDKENVTLGYDVTSYESKLGDPKPEEPTIQTGRPHVEPERIKAVETQVTKVQYAVLHSVYEIILS